MFGKGLGAALILGLLTACSAFSTLDAEPSARSSRALAAPGLARDARLLRAVEAHQGAFLRDLETLVNLDSGTEDAPGLAALSALLAERLEGLGAKVDVQAAPPALGPVVKGVFAGTGRAKLLLMIHYDTVFPKGEAARRPFKIAGDKLTGPGVADAKGGIALILHALEILRERGARSYARLTVLFNADEEKGSFGSREELERLARESDYVLSFEPPSTDSVIVATNGVAYVELTVRGRAAHGSEPEKGVNAATELAGQVMQLQGLGDPALGTTVTWTRLEASDRVNVIPETAKATADMRFSVPSELERVRKDADAIVRRRIVPGTSASVHVDKRRPPFARNPESDRLATLAQDIYKSLGRPLDAVAMRFGTDAGYAYHAGEARPAVLEGLGLVGAHLHASEEWAALESVAPRLYLTVRLIEELGGARAEARVFER